jgi:hypothetical protein
VAQYRHHPGLGGEPGVEGGIVEQGRQQYLQRDRSDQNGVGRSPHGTHASGAHTLVQAVAIAEDVTGLQHAVHVPSRPDVYA